MVNEVRARRRRPPLRIVLSRFVSFSGGGAGTQSALPPRGQNSPYVSNERRQDRRRSRLFFWIVAIVDRGDQADCHLAQAAWAATCLRTATEAGRPHVLRLPRRIHAARAGTAVSRATNGRLSEPNLLCCQHFRIGRSHKNKKRLADDWALSILDHGGRLWGGHECFSTNRSEPCCTCALCTTRRNR